MPSEPFDDAVTAANGRRGGAPSLHEISLRVNGETRHLALEPRQVLLDVLRDELGLRGTKSVCTMGNCGACTVHLDGRAVYSCLVLGVECEGREVRTVEGLANGEELHPVQRAFIDCDAYQCGFCTPGQIMSLAALVDGAARESAADERDGDGERTARDKRSGGGTTGDSAIDDAAILRATSGNLCRCGAYRNILEAGRQAADAVANASDGKESAHDAR